MFDFGAALVRTAQLGARPTFELQFYNTQSAQLDALDREIAQINAESDTSGATALLRTKVTDLERTLGLIDDYKTRTDARIAKISLTLELLADLDTLADSSTVADFDAKTLRLTAQYQALSLADADRRARAFPACAESRRAGAG